MKRLLFALMLVACNRGEAPQPQQQQQPAAPAADAQRGRQLAAQYGCNVCHVIPGVEGDHGSLGPSLAGLASRPSISMGAVQNTPANLARFIQDPPSLNPQSSMPPMGIPETDAQDLTAYLLTLK
jgi:cytochrome c2